MSRTRTSGGCRASSATSPCSAARPAASRTSGCAPGSTTGAARIEPEVTADAAAFPVTVRHPRARHRAGLGDGRPTWPRSTSAAWSRGPPSRPACTTPPCRRPRRAVTLRVGFPHGRDPRRPVPGQRPPRRVPRDEPARDPPRARPGLRRGARPRGPGPHEAVQRERDPHQPLPAASRGCSTWPTSSASGSIDECDLETHGFDNLGWAGNPSDDPAWRDGVPRPHPAHRRAGQEPPQRRDLVARQRGRNRRQPRRDGGVGARAATPGGPCTTRATTPASTPTSTRGCTRRLPRPSAIGTDGTRATLLNCTPAQRRRGCAASRSCCASTRTRWATGRARSTDYDALVDEHPRLHGGFVWEWRDHGILTHDRRRHARTTPTAATSARSCTTATS